MTTELAERAWCVVVPHQPRGARTARRRLSTELALVVSPALLADVVATVAELVGNSVRHADPLPGAVIRVAWRLRPGPDTDTVEVRVTDGGAATGVPRLREAGPDSLDGRGLHIVAALAVEWGVDRDGLGQSVWARLRAAKRVPPATAAAPVLATVP
ncbi:ATP-binding protein [Micromonospora zhanjiangensis]|uniref:ATP-binding protein n=1 Tax=Micromonospora zhanjiangensis TaxID=1522057 RepID=A0ABV8KKG3_9ACTN